jgi:hypothetical protein
MPLQATSGAASYDAFGGGAAAGPTYIEDVFSTWLYTGNGSTQTITNGIDLAGKGGLVWTKSRTYGDNGGTPGDHVLWDSSVQLPLNSNTTNAATGTNATATSGGVNSFTSTGFVSRAAFSAANYVTWTFREQAKFFDVVTYTGNSTNRTIAHNLGSVPGCIIVKRTDSAGGSWAVYHRSLGATKYIILNSANASGTYSGYWNDTEPTDTVFSVGGVSGEVNATGGTYVAYIFAHNAGGFGLTGNDNVISCGSFTVSSGTGSTDVNLGYEPQWLLAKPSTDPGFATNWNLYDTMRGWVNTTTAGNVNTRLNPNLSQVETSDKSFQPTATGFTMLNSAVYPGTSITYIYIAIRRGPMKVPTDGTKVFTPVAYSGNSTTDRILTSNFPVDLAINSTSRTSTNTDKLQVFPRLTGGAHLATASTAAEVASSSILVKGFDNNTGVIVGNGGDINSSGQTYVDWMFQRAPGYFDVVCYTGDNATNRQVAHNLGVTPELIIVKSRTGIDDWMVRWSGNTSNNGRLNSNLSFNQSNLINGESSTMFQLANNSSQVNNSSFTYVAYLFATCPGVSKVGSYTGTGTTLQINCGFTGGARFVLIKRTDSTGDWYVWDSARGIVAGNDPYLLINSTAAEVTSTDYVDTFSSGFEITSTAPAAINASGGTFIFLAIA